MNEESQNQPIAPELEARIVALVMGEVSSSERVDLERLLDEQPELRAFKEQMESVDSLLCEVGEGELPNADEDWAMSAGSRAKVVAVLGDPSDEVAEVDALLLVQTESALGEAAQSGSKRTFGKPPPGLRSSSLWSLARAAVIFGGTGLFGLLAVASLIMSQRGASLYSLQTSRSRIAEQSGSVATSEFSDNPIDSEGFSRALEIESLLGRVNSVPATQNIDKSESRFGGRGEGYIDKPITPPSGPYADGSLNDFQYYGSRELGLQQGQTQIANEPMDQPEPSSGVVQRFGLEAAPQVPLSKADAAGEAPVVVVPDGGKISLGGIVRSWGSSSNSEAKKAQQSKPTDESRPSSTPESSLAREFSRDYGSKGNEAAGEGRGDTRPAGSASTMRGGTGLTFKFEPETSAAPPAPVQLPPSLPESIQLRNENVVEAQSDAFFGESKIESKANDDRANNSGSLSGMGGGGYGGRGLFSQPIDGKSLADKRTLGLAEKQTELREAPATQTLTPRIVIEDEEEAIYGETGRTTVPSFGGIDSVTALGNETPPLPYRDFGETKTESFTLDNSDKNGRLFSSQKEAVIESLNENVSDLKVVQEPAARRPSPQSLLRQSARSSGIDEKNAADEAFSTFSLHVSDVSFKLAQAALARGEWPEAAKIRIEEFVNAFDYGDPLPASDESVACAVEQAIHPFLQQRNLLRVSMRTAAEGRASNTPLRLTLLLDNSGSMERYDRQSTVRRAVAMLAEQLKPFDKVTLISFARQPRLLADQVSGVRAEELTQLVASLPSEGGTNIELALNLAFEKAREQQIEGAQNRIVLLTDGAVNLGNADPMKLSNMIVAMRESGIAFDAAGIVADGLNDEVLEALTRKGDGRYYLLDSMEDANDGFARQIAGALRPSAKNVKVQIEFNPDRVGQYKLLGFEKHLLDQEDFRNDQVDAAEMAAAEAGVAVYQFEPKPNGSGDVGSVSVRFRDLSTGQMIEQRWPIPYVADAARSDQATSSMKIATAATMLAAKLRGDPLGESVDLKALSEMLSRLPFRLRTNLHVQQLQQMITQSRQLLGE